MPTENRSSNTEMVSVPEGFMLVERSIWTEQQVEAATACITRLKGVHGMRDRDLAMAAIDAAQCKAPDIALADLLPAPHPHPEPIAWMVGTAIWWTKEEAERDAAATRLPVVPVGPMVDTEEIERLRAALKFYADREHFHFESDDWDTVSGEPLNILWRGDEPDFIEDGTVARGALERQS
ncbi:hypothetical protein [Pseudomonas kermanshahensis]|uniref:hypothetical protein n=1 Tax=Pseudomonas kermanshahensis TaxID=2745482 RepID=UPI002092B81B|nr:hypothetical protein [Pseudomonas kermanshahensis]USS54202.1 hypothetical protein NG836_20645 [Pseudomonas kermanshahensis]